MSTTLTSIAQVRKLDRATLATTPKVHLVGVVTFHEQETGLTYIHDSTAGIALATGVPSRLSTQVGTGCRVEVEGVAMEGKFSPVVSGIDGAPPRVRVLGRAPLPAPLAVGAEELAYGVHEGRWIELHGVVRSLEAKLYDTREGDFVEESDAENVPAATTRLSIELGTVAGRFTVIIPWKADRTPPGHFLESRIRLRAVLGSIVNQRNQWAGVLLYTPSLDHVTIERPPLVDPFSLPLVRTDEILRFKPDRPDEERVRVQGTVTVIQPRYRLFLASDHGPLEVQSRHSQTDLRPGTRVDVVGYPALLGSRVVLQNAVFKRIGVEAPPRPIETTRTEAMARYMDGALVRIRGTLMQTTMRGTARMLLVETEDSILEISFTRNLSADDLTRIQKLKPGSELAINGIAQVHSAAEWSGGTRPYSLSMLVQDVSDIEVTRHPPWWTVGRLLSLVGLLLTTIVLGLVWVYLLQRRVERQTSIIRQNLEREAVWEERSRIARDIHDDVGAALTQISLLGELGRREGLPAEDVKRQLERIASKAREAVRSLDEIVWTVNPRNDSIARTSSYLCQAAQDLLAGTSIRCRLDVPDDLPEIGLGARARHHLFLAMKESVHNVIKHSGATEMHLRLAADTSGFSLTVADNGRGFDCSELKTHRSGIDNLRRRLKEVGGVCEIASSKEGGTSITLRIPSSIVPHT